MTRKRLLMYAIAAAVFLAAACARLYVEPSNATRPGFRYYLPRPYLLVTPDTAQIVWLPDLSQQYAMDPVAGMGTLKLNLTLENGWKLTSVTHDLDSKVPETVESVGKVIASVVAAATGTGAAKAVVNAVRDISRESPQAPPDSLKRVEPFQFYELKYDSTGTEVTGVELLVAMPKDTTPKPKK